MLPPDYFTNKEDRILELYRQLEDFILKDIAGRLLAAGEMSGTADRLLYKLRMMGESRQEIQKKLMQLTGLSNLELKALLQDAVLTSWEDDSATFRELGIEISSPLENDAVIRVMDAEYKKSLGELSNLTRTTMRQSQADLMNMMDEAEIRVASGVQSYSAAICDILDRYAGKGIEVEYPTGTKRSLEASVRMCVVTSMNQTTAQVTNQYILEAKSEVVLVSAHLGARVQGKGQPELAGHDNWQGKAYRIRGSEPGYPNLLESTGYDIDPETGQGKVVNPLGLHGYNCRHGHQPWDKRLRNPYVDENGKLKIDTEENRKRYGLQQKQRAMERAIRKTKRELIMKQQEIDMIAETDVKSILQSDYDEMAAKWREQNKKYNDFCKANDLQPQYDRIKVSEFNRQQSSKANSAATRYANKQTESRMGNEKQNTGGTVAQEGKSNYNSVRSREELEEAARAISDNIKSYAHNASKWSGNIVVDNSLSLNNALGVKEWNCDISLIDTADNATIWHEMLHSCSASYYTPEIYLKNEYIEEASVEFLTQQICKQLKIVSIQCYEEYTEILQVLNDKFDYGTDMEFSKELFNIPLPERYQWLENKVEQSLRDMNASFEDFNEVMQYIQELKGGSNG